jgi:hypothetical protein
MEYRELMTNAVELAIQVELKPFVKPLLIDKLPSWKIFHRSRAHTVASKKLQINEMYKRESRYTQWNQLASEHGLTDAQSYELATICCESMKENMRVDMKHISSFIRERWTRGIGEHRKWAETSILTSSEWEQIKNNLQYLLEYIEDHPGAMFDITYNPGSRARGDSFDKFMETYYYVVEVSRMIMFGPPWSQLSVLMPKEYKDRCARKIMQAFRDTLQGTVEFVVPYEEGGGIFQKTSDLHLEGRRFFAFDYSTFDALVPSVLGPGFNAFMIRFGDSIQLPSGITPTSWFGTAANYVLNHNLQGTIIGMGDDVNWYPDDQKQRLDTVPYLNESKGDTDAMYTLGLEFRSNPERPALCGLKFMKDNREEVKSMKIGTDWDVVGGVGVQDARREALHTAMFHGWFGDRSLLEAIKRIPASDFISPGQMFERLIAEELTAAKIDPFAWAERIGAKKVFTA